MVRIDISLDAENKQIFINSIRRDRINLSLSNKIVSFELQNDYNDSIAFMTMCSYLLKNKIERFGVIPINEKSLILEPFLFQFKNGIVVDYDIETYADDILHKVAIQFDDVKIMGVNNGTKFEM